jgi:serine protease Do
VVGCVLAAAVLVLCVCLALAVAWVGAMQARNVIENMAPELQQQLPPTFPTMVPVFPVVPELDELRQLMGGAMVSEVVADSPAALAGIQPGDLIRAVDGEPVTAETSLSDLISAHAPGDEVRLALVRLSRGSTDEEEVSVVLGANPRAENLGYLGVRALPFFTPE